MPSIASILADFASLSATEKSAVRDRILHSSVASASDMKEFVESVRFAEGRTCVHCHGKRVVRNGHQKDGSQRYFCKDCAKSFVITSNSIASGTRYPLSTWERFIDCMVDGFSVRKSADICGIHRNTAFIWRHKLLDALQEMADDVTLDGIVEADETFFDVSYKGNHSKGSFVMPRKPRKRGGSSKKRGISSDKVCVPCAVNRSGMSIAKVANLARVKLAGLNAIIENRIPAGSHLITDKETVYRRFARKTGVELHQLKADTDSRKGIYNLQHINNYHSQLKNFMRRFNGVSTKYLNNYLIWHNFVNYAKEEYQEKRRVLLVFVLTVYKQINCTTLSSRESLPVML